MKEKYLGAFWGIILILAGAFFLLVGHNSFVIRDPYIGMALNGGLSILFFATYFLSSTRRWGWLFPACIFAGAGLVILMSIIPGVNGGVVAAPVLLSVAVPFLVVYIQKPETRRWALIPVYVMVVLALVVSFAEWIAGELVATLVLLSIALPFLLVYLANRARKWALIPFGVLTVISLIPAMASVLSDNSMGAAVMFLLATPFLVVYFWSQRNWWALLPAGLFLSLGVIILLTLTVLAGHNDTEPMMQQVVGGLLFLGWAATFLVLWLRRASVPTAWAIYPASVLGVLSLAAFIGGQKGLNYIWPLAIIAGGLILLYNSYRHKLA